MNPRLPECGVGLSPDHRPYDLREVLVCDGEESDGVGALTGVVVELGHGRPVDLVHVVQLRRVGAGHVQHGVCNNKMKERKA